MKMLEKEIVGFVDAAELVGGGRSTSFAGGESMLPRENAGCYAGYTGSKQARERAGRRAGVTSDLE